MKSFIENVKEKAIGQAVFKSVKPGETVIKIVHDEIKCMLGDKLSELNLKHTPPITIMLSGLQGSGKTTTAAKLAYFLRRKKRKKVLLVSTDVYRPAAIQQLADLAQQTTCDFFVSESKIPLEIAQQSIEYAKRKQHEIVIIDTAGRTHIDDKMMQELIKLEKHLICKEHLFVADSMAGQDAIKVAKSFNDKLNITGIILTKLDGDARGGAALSVKYIIEKAIKFIGISEKIDGLEEFDPGKMTSRILNMDGISTFLDQMSKKISKKDLKGIKEKAKNKQDLDFNDFSLQLDQAKKMQNSALLKNKLKNNIAANKMLSTKNIITQQAIIQSMTKKERLNPLIVKNRSRKLRIANGSGTKIEDVNRIIKQIKQMNLVFKKLSTKGKNKKQITNKLHNTFGMNSELNDLFK